MKPRFIILSALLTLVASSTIWRAMHPRQQTQQSFESTATRPAPLFQLLDQHSRPVQLSGYMNRYRILLCFFDAAKGPDADPVLTRLKESYPALKRSGIMVFAISSPLGPDQKPSALSYSFPVLRDTLAGQPGSCSVLWGRARFVEGSATSVQPATFFIEANGMVNWEGDAPKPVEDPLQLIRELLD